MFKNYFKTAWRNLMNNKFYSALNIIGLTVGLAVGLLILLWVNDERSFDRFNRDAANIYRVNTALGTGLSKGVYDVTQATIAFHALKEVPGVKNAVRIMENGDYAIFSYGNKVLSGNQGLFVDSSFFKVFDYKLLKGSREQPFSGPQSVIITQTAAQRFFGTADPMGKILVANNKESFTVSGIMADFPENSSFKADMLFPTSLCQKRYQVQGSYWPSLDEDWGNYSWGTYLQLQPGVSTTAVADQLTKINIKHQPGFKPIEIGEYHLQALTDIHLHAPDGSGEGKQLVNIFTIVAMLILGIAVINYINLSTARAMLRAKEVSLRKIIGAGRQQLITQFVIETFLFFVITLCLAFVLMTALMPLYNNIAGKQMHINVLDADLWKVIGFTVLATMLASGIYPALLLSSFEPLNALKGKLSWGIGNIAFRKVLVVCQFVCSIGLIIGTVIIHRQLNFIREKKLGYDKSYVFSFNMRNMKDHLDAVAATLRSQPAIQGVTTASGNIVSVPNATVDIRWEGKDPNLSFFVHPLGIDKDFLDFFKLQLASGANFTGSRADSAHFILNETAVKEAGIKDPLGKSLTFYGSTGTIIGVVKDFHFASLKEKIQPFIFYYRPVSNQLFVRTTAGQSAAAIKAVEKLWPQYNTDFPLEYRFMDETFDNLYRSDRQTGALFDYFTIIAILISCLGLFGLATYAAHVKVKEIGIRKALGASVLNITTMLSRDFLTLIIIAIIIAMPVAWWAVDQWLVNFAYRVTIRWWVFVTAGAGALLIALGTVSFQAIKAALANPVKSLRAE